MNIAFFGGCLNRQRGLDADKHYHAIVCRHIIDHTGVAPGTGMYFYSSFHQLQRKIKTVLNGDVKYNCVVVFIRPFTLIPLTKLVVRYTDKNKKGRMTLHPVFTRRPYYDLMIDETRIRPGAEKHGFLHHFFQQLNGYAGYLLNLPKWAIDEVMTILTEIHNLTNERKIQLVIMGPMLYPGVTRINNTCIELNKRVKAFTVANDIPHIDVARMIDDAGNAMVEADLKHLTAVSHAYMATEILKYINDKIEETVKPGEVQVMESATSAPAPNQQ